jgi:hypothetical protein
LDAIEESKLKGKTWIQEVAGDVSKSWLILLGIYMRKSTGAAFSIHCPGTGPRAHLVIAFVLFW